MDARVRLGWIEAPAPRQAEDELAEAVEEPIIGSGLVQAPGEDVLVEAEGGARVPDAASPRARSRPDRRR